jgi:hypothetical protein
MSPRLTFSQDFYQHFVHTSSNTTELPKHVRSEDSMNKNNSTNLHAQLKIWMDGWLVGWSVGWMDEWMDGWIDG